MASIQSNYDINVSKEEYTTYGNRYYQKHFCRIELGAVLEEEAVAKYNEIVSRFPTEHGFECTLTRWECSGRTIKTNDMTI